jgi:RNA polymerase sigma factor (sigma-70 family)
MLEWSEVYQRYHPEILAFLRRKLWRRAELAEDLCQETFTRAMSASVEMRDPGRVRAYLYRTANNLVINHIRRRGRVVVEADLGTEVSIVDGQADPQAVDPQTAAERAELGDRIRVLVNDLPDDMRIAFQRGIIDRQPYAQIADEQNWTVGKVKICVYRARKQLMEKLSDLR